MPNIKPVSDLRNYPQVLAEVEPGRPVYLTKNGRGRYALVDISEIEEYERLKAAMELLRAVEEGRRSGEEEGWLTLDEAEARLAERKS